MKKNKNKSTKIRTVSIDANVLNNLINALKELQLEVSNIMIQEKSITSKKGDKKKSKEIKETNPIDLVAKKEVAKILMEQDEFPTEIAEEGKASKEIMKNKKPKA